MTTFHLERALLPDGVHDDVVVEIADGRFSSVTPGGTAAERLPGLTIPGLANTHSHAFHRALRGRTQREREGHAGEQEGQRPPQRHAAAGASVPPPQSRGLQCQHEHEQVRHPARLEKPRHQPSAPLRRHNS